MLNYLQLALKAVLRYPRMIIFVYLITLIPGLIIAGVFYNIVVTEGNGSLVLDKLLADFDYMIFTDFMRHHAKTLIPLYLLVFGVGGLYAILSELLTGGIFYHFKTKPSRFRLRIFLREGWRMFGKYLLIFLMQLFVLFLVFLLSGLFYFVFSLIAEGGSEKEYILWLSVPTILLIFMGSLVMLITDYARYIILEHTHLGIWQGFSKGFTYVFKNFQTVGFFWIVTGFGVVLGLVYLGLDSLIGMKGMFSVLLMFLIQQAVVIGRVFLKNLNYAVISEFYQKQPLNLPIPVTETFFEDLPDELDENEPSAKE